MITPVADFLLTMSGDIRRLHEIACELANERSDLEITEPLDDYVAAPKESGYRGLKQQFGIQLGPSEWFPFELQLMTYLQHDWDQRQHHIYEDLELFPDNIKDRYRSLSERLEDVEQEFARVQEAVRRYIGD
jgi:ppGpp synthetase/RelA/SpoT-type nucleotidyltranferase